MCKTMCMVGKRAGRASVVATASCLKDGLLFVWDKIFGERFLVRTGVEVSVFPATELLTSTKHPGTSLVVAKSSTLKTYGMCSIPLRFTSKQYRWDFVIALAGGCLLTSQFAPGRCKGKAPSGCRDILFISTMQSRGFGTPSQHYISNIK